MKVEDKLKFIAKILPEQDNIYLDYISFHPKQSISLAALKENWKTGIDTDSQVQFYLHIPFCSRICTYCMYNTLEIHDTKEIDLYIDALISYLGEFVSLFKNIRFNGMYIGGGTPSILSPVQMKRLFGYISKNFQFNDAYYRTIELNPSSTTFEKLDEIYKNGFTRVSFGVQSFNKQTLDIENRTYVAPQRIAEIVDYAKKLGFGDVNCDLILGLNEEGEKDILYSLKEMKKIAPYSISVYTILKDMERSIIYKTDADSFYREVKKIYQNIVRDSDITQDYINPEWSNVLGFKLVSLGHPGPKKDYEAHSKEKTSLFAVGHKAFGKIWGIGTYENTHFSSQLISHDYQKLTPEQEISMYILKEFQFKISKTDFYDKFGFHIEERFQDEITFLEQHKIIQQDNGEIVYIGEERKIGYYGLLFLDIKSLVRFVKYRYYEKK